MANHMREIAKMLGVEVGEVFKIKDIAISDNCVFRFSDDCLQTSGANDGNYDWTPALNSRLLGLLYGNLSIHKLPWKPQKNCVYYVPFIIDDEKDMYVQLVWHDDNSDKKRYDMGLVCKTKEGAIALTKKMLAVAQE